MILVDSSVWIDYFNGTSSKQTDWLDNALGEEVIVIGDIILAEVLQGFQKDSDYRRAKELLLDFPIIDLVGKDVAIESASNYRSLRKKGHTIRKTIDVLIATACIHHSLTLLHNDKDFTPFEKHLNLKSVKI
jgi:hypothetical protein